jgi:hypothetical protein
MRWFKKGCFWRVHRLHKFNKGEVGAAERAILSELAVSENLEENVIRLRRRD